MLPGEKQEKTSDSSWGHCREAIQSDLDGTGQERSRKQFCSFTSLLQSQEGFDAAALPAVPPARPWVPPAPALRPLPPAATAFALRGQLEQQHQGPEMHVCFPKRCLMCHRFGHTKLQFPIHQLDIFIAAQGIGWTADSENREQVHSFFVTKTMTSLKV